MKTANSVSERRLAIDDLDQAIVTLSARIHAADYELLVLIREFDERAGFLRWNLSSCAEWCTGGAISVQRRRVRKSVSLMP